MFVARKSHQQRVLTFSSVETEKGEDFRYSDVERQSPEFEGRYKDWVKTRYFDTHGQKWNKKHNGY